MISYRGELSLLSSLAKSGIMAAAVSAAATHHDWTRSWTSRCFFATAWEFRRSLFGHSNVPWLSYYNSLKMGWGFYPSQCILWSHLNSQWQIGITSWNMQAVRKNRITITSNRMMSLWWFSTVAAMDIMTSRRLFGVRQTRMHRDHRKWLYSRPRKVSTAFCFKHQWNLSQLKKDTT